MPEVLQELDKNRLVEVRRRSIRGATLWLNLMQAADGGHVKQCRELWKNIRDVSIEVSDILKTIGAEKERLAAASAAKPSSGSDDGADAA